MTTIIITRPVPVIEKTASVFQKAGLKVFKAPVFDIQTNDSVKSQWLNLAADAWVILSVNALEHAIKINPSLYPSESTQVVAVGPAVVKAWSARFDHPIEHHPLMNSEGVIQLLRKISPQSVKILTTGDGRELLKKHCFENNISYIQINTYHRMPLKLNVSGLAQLFDDQQFVLTATSSDILKAFVNQIPQNLKSKVLHSPLVTGAKRIELLANELGFQYITTARSPSDVEMCETAKKVLKNYQTSILNKFEG